MNYQILHDNNKSMIFVGTGTMSISMCESMVAQGHSAVALSIEEVIAQSASWANNHQFIVVGSDVKFKIMATDAIRNLGGSFFSIVHKYNIMHPTTVIGRGVYVAGFNSFAVKGIQIKDHVFISTHNTFGHYAVVDNYSHISSNCYISKSKIGQGVVVGSYALITNENIDGYTDIVDYTNIKSQSRIVKSITKSGTYYGNRLVDEQNSLQLRIL